MLKKKLWSKYICDSVIYFWKLKITYRPNCRGRNKLVLAYAFESIDPYKYCEKWENAVKKVEKKFVYTITWVI